MKRHFSYANVAATLALLIAISMTPAGAHVSGRVGHLWRGHIKPKLSKAGTINKKRNPVHWTKLKGVPATLADGSDEEWTGVEIVTEISPFDSTSPKTVSPNCPQGKKIIGGGASVFDLFTPGPVGIYQNFPSQNWWIAGAREMSDSAQEWRLTGYAICAPRP